MGLTFREHHIAVQQLDHVLTSSNETGAVTTRPRAVPKRLPVRAGAAVVLCGLGLVNALLPSVNTALTGALIAIGLMLAHAVHRDTRPVVYGRSLAVVAMGFGWFAAVLLAVHLMVTAVLG